MIMAINKDSTVSKMINERMRGIVEGTYSMDFKPREEAKSTSVNLDPDVLMRFKALIADHECTFDNALRMLIEDILNNGLPK